MYLIFLTKWIVKVNPIFLLIFYYFYSLKNCIFRCFNVILQVLKKNANSYFLSFAEKQAKWYFQVV